MQIDQISYVSADWNLNYAWKHSARSFGARLVKRFLVNLLATIDRRAASQPTVALSHARSVIGDFCQLESRALLFHFSYLLTFQRCTNCSTSEPVFINTLALGNGATCCMLPRISIIIKNGPIVACITSRWQNRLFPAISDGLKIQKTLSHFSRSPKQPFLPHGEMPTYVQLYQTFANIKFHGFR